MLLEKLNHIYALLNSRKIFSNVSLDNTNIKDTNHISERFVIKIFQSYLGKTYKNKQNLKSEMSNNSDTKLSKSLSQHSLKPNNKSVEGNNSTKHLYLRDKTIWIIL